MSETESTPTPCPACGEPTTGAFCSACGAATTPGMVAAMPGAPAVVPMSPTGMEEAPPQSPPPPPPAPNYPPPMAAMPAPPAGWQMAPQPPAPYATWLRRVGGSLIDSLVFTLPFFILAGSGLAVGLSTLHWTCSNQADGSSSCVSDPGSHFNSAGIILLLLAGLWFIAWYVYVLVAIGGRHGATVGMRAVKIRCVRDTTFDQVGMGRSFGRLAITFVFNLISFLGLIDLLFPLWDQKRQTLHDKVVSTVVLYEG